MQKLLLHAAIGFSVTLGAGVVSAQNGHICDAHPKTRHSGDWKRISLTTPTSTPIVTAGEPTWEILFIHETGNTDCEPALSTIDTSRSVTHTCTVGGGVTVGGSVEFAAGALFAKCKTTASAQVEVNGNFSDTNEVAVSIQSQKKIPPCEIKKYTFKMQKKTATGTVDTYDHKIVCRSGRGKLWTGYCNQTTLTGDAVGWRDTADMWFHLGRTKECPCDSDEGGVIIEDSGGKKGQ